MSNHSFENQLGSSEFIRERVTLLHTLGDVASRPENAAYRLTDVGDMVEVYAGTHPAIEAEGITYDSPGLYVVVFSSLKGALYDVQSMAIGGPHRLPNTRSMAEINRLSRQPNAAHAADRDAHVRRAVEVTEFSQPLAQRHLDWFVDDVPDNFNRRVKNWQLLLS